MLYMNQKKEALEIHEKAVAKYNATYKKIEKLGQGLYHERCESIVLIEKIEDLVNSIANHPKEFEKTISEIQAEKAIFRNTEAYAREAQKNTFKSGMGVAAGIAGGVAVASAAPTVAMWVATTFGTASTGTAISTLSGAVATKAALAWLGGGALSAGGAGIAGGQALLALAGPIGWGIAGATTTVSVVSLGSKNKKIADHAIEEAKKITKAGAELHQLGAKIDQLKKKTDMFKRALQDMYTGNYGLQGANYLDLTEEEQYRLGTMVNNTLTLAQMLNVTV